MTDMDNKPRKAIIYCRHALANADGIQRQETRCREYATKHGYNVVQVFRDNGVGGNTADRAGLNDLIEFLGNASNKKHIVLVDEVARIARNGKLYYQLINDFTNLGAKVLVCT